VLLKRWSANGENIDNRSAKDGTGGITISPRSRI
jgi:hypothetical protein